MSKSSIQKFRLLGLAGLLFSSMLFSISAAAESDVQSLFLQAQTQYDRQDYKGALESIKQAIKLAPQSSSFYHFLGKCYGMLANQANWLKAPTLARKTLRSFRKAVELDNHNIAALRDLHEYYRRAPGFVGGNKNKAKEIEELLAGLENTS